MAGSAPQVYGNDTPPIGDLPGLPTGPREVHPPSATPGLDGPGHTSTEQPPPAGPAAQSGGGSLPLTGSDVLLLIVALAIVALVAGATLRVKSNRAGDS